MRKFFKNSHYLISHYTIDFMKMMNENKENLSADIIEKFIIDWCNDFCRDIERKEKEDDK